MKYICKYYKIGKAKQFYLDRSMSKLWPRVFKGEKDLHTQHTQLASLWQPQERLPKQTERQIHVKSNIVLCTGSNIRKCITIIPPACLKGGRGSHQELLQCNTLPTSSFLLSLYANLRSNHLFISNGRKSMNKCLPLITCVVVLGRCCEQSNSAIGVMFLTWQVKV